VTFDELAATYAEATRALVEGGVDLILVETIFDTLTRRPRCLPCAACWTRQGWTCR